jgi:hypothetical protein
MSLDGGIMLLIIEQKTSGVMVRVEADLLKLECEFNDDFVFKVIKR